MGVANSVRVEFQRPHGNPDGPVVTIQINVRSRTGTYIPQPPRPSVVVRRSVSSSSSSVRSTRACCKEKRRVIVFTLGGVSFRPCVFFSSAFFIRAFFCVPRAERVRSRDGTDTATRDGTDTDTTLHREGEGQFFTTRGRLGR